MTTKFTTRLCQAWRVMFPKKQSLKDKLQNRVIYQSDPIKREIVEAYVMPDKPDLSNLEFETTIQDYNLSLLSKETEKLIIDLIVKDNKRRVEH